MRLFNSVLSLTFHWITDIVKFKQWYEVWNERKSFYFSGWRRVHQTFRGRPSESHRRRERVSCIIFWSCAQNSISNLRHYLTLNTLPMAPCKPVSRKAGTQVAGYKTFGAYVTGLPLWRRCESTGTRPKQSSSGGLGKKLQKICVFRSLTFVTSLYPVCFGLGLSLFF